MCLYKLSFEVTSHSGEVRFASCLNLNAALSPDFILKILPTLKFRGSDPS